MTDPNEIIVRPILTEKMTTLKELRNQYAFEVSRQANKIEIKKAVEQRFNVAVIDVRTMNVRGKKRRMGRFEGKRSQWKKAVVTLQADNVIDFVAGAT
jgi:large subunit ribosomal protein L23